jgi:hypothetical protein
MTPTIVPKLTVKTYVDGELDLDLSPLSIQIQSMGSSCSFDLVPQKWNQTSDYLGKFVRVDAKYHGGTTKTLFCGYIYKESRNASTQDVTLEAKSLLALGDDFYIGAGAIIYHGLEVKYPKAAFFNGQLMSTLWTTRQIIKDWFSASIPTWRYGAGSLPANVRALLKLGNTSILDSIYSQIKLDDITFKQQTLNEGLDTLLSIINNVSIRERFEGNITYLDFYELGSPEGEVKRIPFNNDPNNDTKETLFSFSEDVDVDEAKDRLIVIGDRRKFIVTFPLIPDWDTEDMFLLADVLSNPSGEIKEGELSFDQSREQYWMRRNKVLRSYKIPSSLLKMVIDENLPILDANGTQIPTRVFSNKYIPTFNETTQEWVSTINGYEVLAANIDLRNGKVILNNPAVYMQRAYVNNTNKPVEEYQPKDVYITLCYNEGRLYYDTGKISSKNVNFAGGLDRTKVIEASGFQYIQYGNQGFPLPDLDVSQAIIYDEASNQWNVLLDSTYADDEADLALYSTIALTELNRSKRGWSIEFPRLTWAFKIGDRVSVEGQRGVQQICQIIYNLTDDHSTQITTDNSLPLIANQVLTKEVAI